MKNQENIDELLKQALTEEDNEVLKRIEEQGIFEQLATNFQGKLKWVAMFSAFIMFFLTGFAFYSFFQFYNATDIREMMLWGAGMGISMMAVGQLKTWHWMQMDKNSLLREIKRLEYQVSLLNKI